MNILNLKSVIYIAKLPTRWLEKIFLNIFKIWEAEVGREDDKDKDDID